MPILYHRLFVLTAIVIGFAMTAFCVILAIRARADLGHDHVHARFSKIKAKE
jgi:multicomponent K+:H+ antiporter subunit C